MITIEQFRDAKGAYGYGIRGGPPHRQTKVILRPDRIVLDAQVHDLSWLQQVPPRGLFKKAAFAENTMVDTLAEGFLITSGVVRVYDEEWPRLSKADRARSRRHYFAAMDRSRRIVNKVVRETLAEAADPEIVKLARRFPRRSRHRIYRHASKSPYAAQLAVAHPLLALWAYGADSWLDETRDKVQCAREMVEQGRKLRDIERFVGIPRWYRRVHPGAVGEARHAWPEHYIAHMPTTTGKQIAWLRLMEQAHDADASENVLRWTAKRAVDFGSDWYATRADYANLIDWMRASQAGRSDLVRRPFHPDMSLTTVRDLSAEWHYATALADHRSNATFPKPWLPEKTINDYTFRPIKTPQELFIEGRELHNCLASYVDKIVMNQAFIYSVRIGDKRVGALSLARCHLMLNSHGSIDQLAGPCNAAVPKEAWRAARKFVDQPIKIEPVSISNPFSDLDDDEDQIPF